MLPIGKPVAKFDEGNMCDLDDFESSSSNMDLFDDDKHDSFDLFDGVLDTPDAANFPKKSKVIRVFPNGDMLLEKNNFASISTNEEKELIEYLNNASCPSPTPSVQHANGSRKRSYTDSVNVDSCSTLTRPNEGACMTKSAIAARENRKKKKKYTEELETTVEKLQTENTSLKTKNNVLQSSLDQLETEVKYLKSVIANQTTLAHLIGNIQNTPGVKFQTSLTVDTYDKENIKDINDNAVSKSVKPPVDINDNAVSKSVKPPVETNKPKHVDTKTTTMCTRYGKLRKDSSAISKPKDVKRLSTVECSTCSKDPEKLDQACAPAGVCLHVSNGSVSLEFCAKCSSSAAFTKSITFDHSYGKVQGEG